jgi:hypothetical protein
MDRFALAFRRSPKYNLPRRFLDGSRVSVGSVMEDRPGTLPIPLLLHKGPRMVRRLFLLSFLGVFSVGCQSQSNPRLAMLPPPTFDAPRVAPAAPQPLPAYTAAPSKPKAPAKVASSVPRDWMPSTSPRPWKWIVIHHSATPTGGAASFDRMHRDKGWDELGYHFVIGNGTDSGNGAIEVGSRWPKQKYGAHCKTPDNQFNDFGIGICLVGNFDNGRPSAAQMKALAKLTGHLMKTYRIPPSRVIGHGDAKPTDCPGRFINIASVRSMATKALADAGGSLDDPAFAQATGELLEDTTPEQ